MTLVIAAGLSCSHCNAAAGARLLRAARLICCGRACLGTISVLTYLGPLRRAAL